jgi:hypothetical protein
MIYFIIYILDYQHIEYLFEFKITIIMVIMLINLITSKLLWVFKI